MSKKRERNAAAIQSILLTEAEPVAESTRTGKNSFRGYLKNRLWIAGAVVLLSLGVLGAGLKYLEEDAKKQKMRVSSPTVREGSLLDTINPFLTSPPPTPTPQLKVEYIHAGSRLLAVEDANANAAPPADLAIWRPSNGYFYVLGGPGSQQTYHQWGQSGDIPIPGDYDGDGKTDFSVFRPSTGEWYIVNSSDGTTGGYAFGTSTDTPMPADFDGDGKTDAAVYRRNEPAGLATFYIKNSSNGTWSVQRFGLQTDTPAAADYDGDGRADIGVYRDSNSTFYSLNSANGQLQTANLGSTPGAQPVPADYDGDGRANYALKSGNNWLILNPAGTATSSITWQQSTDIPVQNDYDADGKVDIAVWRPSNGNWLIRQSSLIGQPNELRQVQWGTTGDIPVPAFYRR